MNSKTTLLSTIAIAAFIAALLPIHDARARLTDGEAASEPKQWKAAHFRGLRVGIASPAEVVDEFGSPDRVEVYGPEQTGRHPISWLIYENLADKNFPGFATFWIDDESARLTRITITSENLTRDRLLETLGRGFEMVRYSFCDELGDGEAAPIYEDPLGTIEFMEFRRQGVSVQFDWRGAVQQLTFLSEPEGISKAECESQKKRAD